MFKTFITFFLKVNMQTSLQFKGWVKRLPVGVLRQVLGKTPNFLKKLKIDFQPSTKLSKS